MYTCLYLSGVRVRGIYIEQSFRFAALGQPPWPLVPEDCQGVGTGRADAGDSSFAEYLVLL